MAAAVERALEEVDPSADSTATLFTTAASQRLAELADRLRLGCQHEDCLAIREAAHHASTLLVHCDRAGLAAECRELALPRDDWDEMLRQAQRLLRCLDAAAVELRVLVALPRKPR